MLELIATYITIGELALHHKTVAENELLEWRRQWATDFERWTPPWKSKLANDIRQKIEQNNVDGSSTLSHETVYDTIMSCSKSNPRQLCIQLLRCSNVQCIAETMTTKPRKIKPIFIPDFHNVMDRLRDVRTIDELAQKVLVLLLQYNAQPSLIKLFINVEVERNDVIHQIDNFPHTAQDDFLYTYSTPQHDVIDRTLSPLSPSSPKLPREPPSAELPRQSSSPILPREPSSPILPPKLPHSGLSVASL